MGEAGEIDGGERGEIERERESKKGSKCRIY